MLTKKIMAVIMSAAALTVTACSSSSDNSVSGSTATPGASGNSMSVAVTGQFSNLDPGLNTETNNGYAISHLYSAMFRRATDGTIVPMLAEDYTVSDDGLTWSLPQDITYATFPSMRNAFALGPGHGICTHDGILLVPVWMVPKEFGQPVDSHVPSIISTLYSLDSGKTWDMGEMLGDTEEIVSPNETVAAELPDGQIYLNIRNMTNYRARAYSVTGIDEWTEYGRDKDLPDPVCFGSVIRFQADLYFVNCNSTERRANVCLRKSSDGGRTWPALLPIDKDRGGYAEIAADETVPLIYVLYEEDGGTCCHLARIDPT